MKYMARVRRARNGVICIALGPCNEFYACCNVHAGVSLYAHETASRQMNVYALHHLADVTNPYEFYTARDVHYYGLVNMPAIAHLLSSPYASVCGSGARELSRSSEEAVGGAPDADLDRLFGLMLRVTQYDDWGVRQSKREAGVYHVKLTADYQRVQHELFSHLRPATPDPTDRSLSKRTWERDMQAWREALRAIGNDEQQ